MTKSFVVVAAIFVLVGGSIGGAFTGGVILGRNQAESEAPAAANFVPPEGFSSDQAAASATDGRSVVPGRRSKPECVGDIGQEYRGDGEPDVSVGCLRREPGSARLRGQRGNNGRWLTDSPALQGSDVALGLFGGGATFGTIDSIGEGVVVINTPSRPR